jgi:hypothetical protein
VKTVTAIMVVTILGIGLLLPYLTYAFFTEPFTAFASSFIKIGSTLDQSLSFAASEAKKGITAVTDVALNAKTQISRQQARLAQGAAHTAKRQHQILTHHYQALASATASLKDIPPALYENTSTFLKHVAEGARALFASDLFPTREKTQEEAEEAPEAQTITETPPQQHTLHH